MDRDFRKEFYSDEVEEVERNGFRWVDRKWVVDLLDDYDIMCDELDKVREELDLALSTIEAYKNNDGKIIEKLVKERDKCFALFEGERDVNIAITGNNNKLREEIDKVRKELQEANELMTKALDRAVFYEDDRDKWKALAIELRDWQQHHDCFLDNQEEDGE